jgi:inosine-uridine nucleoside N-ribohydrolase
MKINTQSILPINWRSLLRITGISLAVISGLVQVFYLWNGLEGLQSHWQVLNSYPAVKNWLEFDTHLMIQLGMRWLAVACNWLAAIGITLQLQGQPGRLALFGRLTALMLVLLPGVFVTGDLGNSLPVPAFWAGLLAGLSGVLAVLAFFLLLSFYFLFPDLRFSPAWLGWLAVPAVAGGVLVTALFFSGTLNGDEQWLVLLLVLFIALLLGTGSQVYRYMRRADRLQRCQTRLVIACLALLTLSIVGTFFLSEMGWPSLVSLLWQMLALTLLPLAVWEAVSRRGLWQAQPTARHLDNRWRWAGILTALLGFLALAARFNSLAQAETVAFEPLPENPSPRPVVIDTDMGLDDWLAILLLLQRPEVEVKAITITGTGETHCQPGVRNALGLIALAGETGIPVACGREMPLEGQNAFPDDMRQFADSMAGLTPPAADNPAVGMDAVELIAQILEGWPGEVTVIAVGPLTNLGEGLQREPEFLRQVNQVYIMGGALKVMGNVWYFDIDNQVAEWNIFCDPRAAQLVFESGAPLTLVPLDATNQVPMDLDFYRLLKANRRTPEAEFAYQALRARLEPVALGHFSFWDTLTAALLVDESLGYILEGRIRIYPAPGPSSGLTRLMDSGMPMRYALSAHKQRFESEFLRTLNQP